MELRDQILNDLKLAMKARDTARLSTLRLISAALKERDIALRGEGAARDLSEADVIAILTKMAKQRQDSARIYLEGARPELAAREQAEIDVIEAYLPQSLTEAETLSAIDAEIATLDAPSIRDMGRVMNALRSRYAGQMDFAAVGALVKARLS